MDFHFNTKFINATINELIGAVIRSRHLDKYCETLSVAFDFTTLIERIKSLLSSTEEKKSVRRNNIEDTKVNSFTDKKENRRIDSVFDLNVENSFESQEGELVLLINAKINTLNNPAGFGHAKVGAVVDLAALNTYTNLPADPPSDEVSFLHRKRHIKFPITLTMNGFPFRASLRILIKTQLDDATLIADKDQNKNIDGDNANYSNNNSSNNNNEPPVDSSIFSGSSKNIKGHNKQEETPRTFPFTKKQLSQQTAIKNVPSKTSSLFSDSQQPDFSSVTTKEFISDLEDESMPFYMQQQNEQRLGRSLFTLKVTVVYSLQEFYIDDSLIDYTQTNLSNIIFYKQIIKFAVGVLNKRLKEGSAGSFSFLTSVYTGG